MPDPKPTETPQPTKPPEDQSLTELSKSIDELQRTEGEKKEPLVIEFEDGGKFTADTPEDMIEQLKKAKGDTGKALRDRERQIRELQEQVNALKGSRQEPAPDARKPFDRAEYFRLFEDSPLDAQNYLDSYRMGIEDPREVPVRLQSLHVGAEEMADIREAHAFRSRCPDFPGDDTAVAAVKAQLAEEGREWTADNLEIAWIHAVRDGKAKPKMAVASEEPEGEPPKRPRTPPRLDGTGGRSEKTLEEMAEDMSYADLRKLLIEKGHIVQ